MKEIIKRFKPYVHYIILITVLLIVQAMSDLTLPEYMSEIVNVGIPSGDINYILQKGGVMLAIAAIGGLATICVSFLASRMGAGVAKSLRSDVFAKVESFSLAEFDKFSTASLITRSTNDIQNIQMFAIMFLRMVLFSPIMAIGGIMKAGQTNLSLMWILAVSVPLNLIFIALLMGKLMPRFLKLQKQVDRLNQVSRESLTGTRVIRAFNTQKHEEDRFDKANKALTDTHIYVNKTMAFMNPITQLLMNLTIIAIIWFGAQKISQGALDVGGVMAFQQYSMHIMFSFMMISFVFIMAPRAIVSIRRVGEILSTEVSIQDPEKPVLPTTETKGLVEFKNVGFSYPGAQDAVLRNVTFTARPGQTTAFIGSTGSGKSTLINLIPRFYDCTEGEILIDGVNIRDYAQSDLREKLGYVPQKGMLFSGTVESNLRFGNENATEYEIMRSIEVAQASEFITQKEDGIKSEIAQNGTNVSGGQKQRLSIARALMKKPEIFIFDDSFSALDFKTDAALRKALKESTSEATVLIVGQRISTIMNAEQIVVLDEGDVVGIGTHAQLMESCETYREIATSQLSKEELA